MSICCRGRGRLPMGDQCLKERKKIRINKVRQPSLAPRCGGPPCAFTASRNIQEVFGWPQICRNLSRHCSLHIIGNHWACASCGGPCCSITVWESIAREENILRTGLVASECCAELSGGWRGSVYLTPSTARSANRKGGMAVFSAIGI